MNVTINYLGHSSFRIKSIATVITDPYDISTGLHFSKQEADICTISHKHKDHSNREGIKNESCFFIDAPGEYEIKDVMIRGYRSYHDQVNGEENGFSNIYLYETEGFKICHLGDLGTEKIDEKILKEIAECHLLFIPVGGTYTIGPAQAKEIIKRIEPNYVVPMHYKVAGMSETFNSLKTVDDFLKEMGAEIEPVDKLILSETALPDETEIVVLNRKK